MYGLGAHSQLSFGQLVSFDLTPVTASAALLMSAFNFCNPFDYILPFADGNPIDANDRRHMWGLYIGIDSTGVATPYYYQMLLSGARL